MLPKSDRVSGLENTHGVDDLVNQGLGRPGADLCLLLRACQRRVTRVVTIEDAASLTKFVI